MTLMLLAAATAYPYGQADVTEGLSSVVSHTTDVMLTEPAVLLLSGALLIASGALVRRFSF